jgi:hypothetical protein
VKVLSRRERIDAVGTTVVVVHDSAERVRDGFLDTLQLGGDFVIDSEGRVHFAHPQESADDRVPVGILVRELERAAAN